MADRVNAATERLLRPFSEIKKAKLCEPEESQSVLRRITQFEYKIARNQRSINDYDGYLDFLENFLKLLDVRRKKLQFFEFYKEIDAVFIAKLFNLYEQAYFHFPHHLQFFSKALDAAKTFNTLGRARRIWERYIELHASSKAYLSAAAYKIFENTHINPPKQNKIPQHFKPFVLLFLQHTIHRRESRLGSSQLLCRRALIFPAGRALLRLEIRGHTALVRVD